MGKMCHSAPYMKLCGATEITSCSPEANKQYKSHHQMLSWKIK